MPEPKKPAAAPEPAAKKPALSKHKLVPLRIKRTFSTGNQVHLAGQVQGFRESDVEGLTTGEDPPAELVKPAK